MVDVLRFLYLAAVLSPVKRLEPGVVDVLGLLYLAAVLSAVGAAVLLVPRGADDDAISVGRHPDALRIAAGHVEAQLVAASGVRIVHEQRPHLLGVEDVRAAAAARHQRVVEHLVAAPDLVDRVQLQKLFSVRHPTNQRLPSAISSLSPTSSVVQLWLTQDFIFVGYRFN